MKDLIVMNVFPSLSPEQLLALLEVVIREAPAFNYTEALSEADQRWLARANALIQESGSAQAAMSFSMARSHLGTVRHSREELMQPLHDVYYLIELRAPAESRGTFIPSGDTWNGYAAIVKLIQKDCDDLFIVDPYLNATIFTDFAPHSAAKIGSRLLTTKRSENEAGLKASPAKWASDSIGLKHPIEVKYAPNGSLHDRLIIIDRKEVWLISQSFKDIAKRSPASVSRADSEMASMKADHYEQLWLQSSSIFNHFD